MQADQRARAELRKELAALRKRVSKLETLQESEEKWHSLVKNAPNFIIITDTEGSIQFINRTAPGCSVEETLGKTVYDFLEPAYHNLARTAIKRLFQRGEQSKYEARVTVPGGNTYWYETHVGPIKRDGKVTAATLISTDISARKKAEEALRQSEETVRAFFDAIPDTAVLMDTKANILAINKTGAQRLRKSVGEIVGRNAQDILPPEVFEIRRSKAREVIRTGKMLHYEDERAGRCFDTCICPVLDVQRKVERLAVFARDITERKKAEAALRSREELLRNIVSNVPHSIFWKDRNSVYLGCNDNFAEAAGIKNPADIIGKTDYDLPWKKEESDFYRKVDREVMAKGSPTLNIEESVHDASGKSATILTSKVPLRNVDGEIIGILGIYTDITERKKAAAEIRRLSSAVEQSIEGIAIGDLEPKLTFVNEAFARMHGYTRDEMLGMEVLRLHNEQQMAEYNRRMKQIKTHGLWKGEIGHIRKDGTAFPTYMSVSLLKNEQGEATGIIAVAQDITDRKRQEQALRESEENFRAIFDNATDGILVADPKTTKYITGNRMICQMLGYTLDELKNLEVKDIHPQDSLKDDLRRFEKVLNREITLSEDVPIRRKDGSILYADINTAFLRFGGRECLMGTFRDITEHKQAELRLERYREKMARAEQLASLGTLSATLAHELTQPLTVVRLSIENSLADLETTSCPASVTEGLKDSLAEMSHTVSIIDRLRNFARKSSKDDITEVDLKAVAERITQLLDGHSRRAGITVRLKDMDSLPPILANEKDMEQLFFALVENAIHAAEGRKNRQLIISAAIEGQHVELQFSDNCCGIARADIDRIFEPFFTTKPAGEGTGLGLCIVQRIVSHAGGKIRVESKTGKGSTFFVTLPIKRTEGS